MDDYRNRKSLPCAHSLFQPKTALINDCPIVALPCVFGWRDNWNSVAQDLAIATNLEVYVIDPRNHGESAHSSDGDYYDMVADIMAFFEEKQITKCHLLGHSMGGRTAMTIAFTRPSMVKSLTCLDISPFSEPAAMPQIVRFFVDTLKEITRNLTKGISIEKARIICSDELQKLNVEKYMQSILVSNLVQKDDGTFTSLANLDYLHSRFETDHFVYPIIDKGYNGPTKFIYAENSEYIKPQDYLKLYKAFPLIDIMTLEGECGHHINLQRPKEMVEIVTQFLQDVK